MKYSFYIILFFLTSIFNVHGQDSLHYDTSYFRSPVDHNIILSGSFGELRKSHFHAGIDIKSTNGSVGDTIFAAAEGYISRIKIQRGGYGRVLYMDHPNGYTTVYAHLLSFHDSLEQYIATMQHESRSYEVDVYPDKNKFTFAKGESIGIMGSTGRSYGPHLHFEIRETQSEIPINPFFFGIKPPDNRKPDLLSFSIEGLNPELQRTWQKIIYPKKTKKGTIIKEQGTFRIPAWRAGIAIQTFDKMNKANNKNGTYGVALFVDDTLFYESKLDGVSFDHTKYIDAHVDYHDKVKHNRTAILTYKHPANRLQIYNDSLSAHPITLYKNKERFIRILLYDFHGNQQEIHFRLLRSEIENSPSFAFDRKIGADSISEFRIGRSHIHFPENSVSKALYFEYKEEQKGENTVYHIHNKFTPVFKYIRVTLPVDGIDSSLLDKYVVQYIDEKKATSYGGEITGDSIQFYTNKLGAYTITVDTIAPVIKEISVQTKTTASDKFTLRLYDNMSARGKAKDVKYNVLINGEWRICPYKSMTNVLTVPLNDLPSGPHNLLIEAVDDRNNKASYQKSFTIVE